MNELLAMIGSVKFLAHDLHYRSKGMSFYALHILADRCLKGLDEDMDSIREVYFMGEMKTLPPTDIDTFEKSIAYTRQVMSTDGEFDSVDLNKILVLRLRLICEMALAKIEELKEPNDLASGTVAVLDGIAVKLQTNYALLDHCATQG